MALVVTKDGRIFGAPFVEREDDDIYLDDNVEHFLMGMNGLFEPIIGNINLETYEIFILRDCDRNFDLQFEKSEIEKERMEKLGIKWLQNNN